MSESFYQPDLNGTKGGYCNSLLREYKIVGLPYYVSYSIIPRTSNTVRVRVRTVDKILENNIIRFFLFYEYSTSSIIITGCFNQDFFDLYGWIKSNMIDLNEDALFKIDPDNDIPLCYLLDDKLRNADINLLLKALEYMLK